MAVTAIVTAKEWLASDAASGLSPAARLTLVLLCEAVNENRIQREGPWDAWPSQGTLAGLVGVTSRQMRRILRETLERDYGVISDTGEVVGRGIVKWEVSEAALSIPPNPDADVCPDAHVRGARETGHGLPGDRTSISATPDIYDRATGHPSPTEPEGNRENTETEIEHGSAPSAADASEAKEVVIFDPEYVDLLEWLDGAADDLPWHSEMLQRLNELNGEEITMDVWARRLPLLREPVAA